MGIHNLISLLGNAANNIFLWLSNIGSQIVHRKHFRSAVEHVMESAKRAEGSPVRSVGLKYRYAIDFVRDRNMDLLTIVRETYQ